jgi:hypothetical protein
MRLLHEVAEGAQPAEAAGALGNACIRAVKLAALCRGHAPNFNPAGAADGHGNARSTDPVVFQQDALKGTPCKINVAPR